MFARRAAALDGDCGARWCVALGTAGGLRRAEALHSLQRGTTLRDWYATSWPAPTRDIRAAERQSRGCASLSGTNFRGGRRSIREKIIGHSMLGLAARVAVDARFLRRQRALAHQPARQQGGGILLQPGIQQLRDLLAEIGGVIETRKFVALQRIAGCRKQELPGRLRFAIHGNLREEQRHPNSISYWSNGTKYVSSVEKCAKFCWGWRASGAGCSTARGES